MYYEIYLDYYFLENLFMDYALLLLTGMVMKRSVNGRRVFLAAFLGSVLACALLFLPFKNAGFTVLMELLAAMLMLWCGYGTVHRSLFVRETVVFSLLSCLCAGMFQIFAGMKGIPMTLLQVLAVVVLGILLSIYAGVRREAEALQSVVLTIHGKNRTLTALYDTGNRLREPYQKRPVNIVEYEAVKELFDKEEKFFLIPCHTVNGSGAMLPGTVIDEMAVARGGRAGKIQHPVIAFTKEKLSSDGSYQMILHPDHNKNQEEKEQ